MGNIGELVRSVFSKSLSARTHESNMRSNSEGRKWKNSVRSYMCGDEFNSVLAKEDSAFVRSSRINEYTQPKFSSVFAEEDYVSVRSSEATVMQPILPDLPGRLPDLPGSFDPPRPPSSASAPSYLYLD